MTKVNNQRDISSFSLNKAIEYAGLGYKIFPCVEHTKKPATKNGFHDASSNEEHIEQWWTHDPGHNVAIATTGLVVIDVDPVEGVDNPWKTSKEYLELINSCGAIAVSPRGGTHLYFKLPQGTDLKCSQSQLAEHVDIKTNGGYIMAAPSYVVDQDKKIDGPYQWIEELPSIEDLPDAPSWLMKRLNKPNQSKNSPSKSTKRKNAYIEGSRNTSLARQAGKMQRDGLDDATILVALKTENRNRCEPPLPDDEVESICASICKYEKGNEVSTCAEPIVKSAAEYEETEIEWLWKPFLAIGKVSLLSGQGGTGKSTITVDIGSRITTGTEWPDGKPNIIGDVFFMTAEDGIADTLIGRLRIAGCDMSRFRFIEGKRDAKGTDLQIELDKDINQIDQALSKYPETRLMIIDPITAFLGGVDYCKNADVRGIMKRLSDLAEKHKVCVLLISHPKKGDSSPYDSVTGSKGFTDACRTALMTVNIPNADNLRAMGLYKSNIGIDQYNLAYSIKVNEEPGLLEPKEITSIEWHGKVDINLDQCLNHRSKDDEKDDKREYTEVQFEAIERAGNYLRNGDLLVSEFNHDLKEGGVSKKAWRSVSNKSGLFYYYRKGNKPGSPQFWGLTEEGKKRFPKSELEPESAESDASTAQENEVQRGEHGNLQQGTEKQEEITTQLCGDL